MKLLITFILSVFFLSAAQAQQKEQRVALVIGNASYKDAPLRNPVNDANDVAATLKGLGFQVILRVNSNRRQMVEAVREFGTSIKRGGVGLFYYSGHGVQSRGKNFLLPVGAHVEGEGDLEFEEMDANMVLAQMDEAANRVNIVVLDACRDNPYTRSFRSTNKGLAQMDSAKGSFLAYATSPGSVASDGDGRNGTDTKHLLNSLSQPDAKLEEVFKCVRLEVARETGNKQIPWDSSSLLGDFYFTAPGTKVASQSNTVIEPQLTATQREDAFWEDAKSVGNKKAFEGYLSSYPSGRYVSLAKANIARISSVKIANAPAVTVPVTSPQARVPGAVFKDCDDCPEMVVIPVGSFLMGSKPDLFASSQPSADEQPQHAVSLKTFAMGKYEVTREQWYAVMGTMPSQFKGRMLPVEQVSWGDAQEFVKKLSEKTGKNYRLPSEAEWEYAARAGSQAAYSFGDNEGDLGRHAWFSQNSNNGTHPVGEKQSNSFGLHDMHGNVWEWTQDCRNRNYDAAPADGSAWATGDCSRRVVRGGSWSADPRFLRAAFRFMYSSASVRSLSIGFRVARTD
jgi:formylglycine-generating enzyme required for sulfatase activity